jgi:hypothetical protein
VKPCPPGSADVEVMLLILLALVTEVAEAMPFVACETEFVLLPLNLPPLHEYINAKAMATHNMFFTFLISQD